MSETGVHLDISATEPFLEPAAVDAASAPVATVAAELAAGTGPGHDFLGWLDLPARITDAELAAIEQEATRLAGLADRCVVVGIGGSYLGARAVLEASSGRMTPGSAWICATISWRGASCATVTVPPMAGGSIWVSVLSRR